MIDKKSVRLRFSANWIYFSVALCFVIIRLLASFGLLSFLGAYGGYFVGFFTQVFLLVLIPFVCLKNYNKLTSKEVFKTLNFKKISFIAILACFALGIVVFFLNVYISSFFQSLISMFGYQHQASTSTLPVTWWMLVLNLFSTAVLPAFCEEFLHRGILLKGNSAMGLRKSIWVSGILFGLLHCNIEQFFYAAIIGVFLGYLCLLCNSIWPCIIVHFVNNASSVFLSFASDKGWAIGDIFSNIGAYVSNNQIFGVVVFFLFLCLLFAIGYMLVKYLVKDSFNRNFLNKQKELATMFIRESYFNDMKEIGDGAYKLADEKVGNKQVIFIDGKEFMDFLGDEDKNLMKSPMQEIKSFKGSPLETKSKILLFGAFLLTAIVTIMTFFWGLL